MSQSDRTVRVAVVQCALPGPRDENVGRVEALVRDAAADDADVVLPPELFEGPYFPQEEREELFDEARPFAGNETLARFSALARELSVAIPFSFFERSGSEHYNSLAMIDADGTVLGLYRKSHIPDGPGYSEKFYFRPGDTGFRVWNTKRARLGVGICWDQWFPECARAMTLGGAEILLYPTAIGSEPALPDTDTQAPWRRAMVGHAVSNAIPVAAANRVGTEGAMRFYGSSFLADQRGDFAAELGRDETGVALATFDLDAIRHYRNGWGFFRDRRPDLYGALADK
jgi:N-carbamoylputrescine amidase